MTSSINNRQIVLNRSESDHATACQDLSFDLSQAISPDAMEQNADSLMNAVFADVDRMLERGVSLPLDAFVGNSAANSASAAAVEAPEISVDQPVPLESILPPKLAPRDLIPQSIGESGELQSVEPSALESASAVLAEPKKSNDSLWMAVLCSSLLVSAAILAYLFRDQVLQMWLAILPQTTAPTTVTAPMAESLPKQDTDFLKYIQRSLDRLAHQSSPNPEKLAAQPSPTTILISPSASPTVVERVYVPVYPVPQAAASPALGTQMPTSPAPQQSPKPAVRPAAPASPSPATAVVPNITATTHTLIGVLALGERSAALFEVDGTPQRIEIGGQIGSSGWALVSINNQEAIVRKNGEVRSIYVGQKF